MHRRYSKAAVKYFLVLVGVLFFIFLSGDFGLVDVQKTAIVMAVGIDREEDTFIITSQVAIPKASDNGKASETVQIVSRGKTVADAFEEINAKTGWYPKLVFCRLILLGEKTAQANVVDALDFFLLDEYLSDNCLLATCDGLAKDVLNVKALVDASGSVAIQKVLSSHAQRVGVVLPTTLREFAIGYYSESSCAFVPLLKTQPQQEKVGETATQAQGQAGQNQKETEQDKPVFSASETALFYKGRRVGKWTEEETFAFNAVKNKLRLAGFLVQADKDNYSLSIKKNRAKTSCKIVGEKQAVYKIELTIFAGLLDSSTAFTKTEGIDVGDTPKSVFEKGENLLKAQITSAFEKAKACGCDVFGIVSAVQKQKKFSMLAQDNRLLLDSKLDLFVRFQNVR